ncbi:VCBS repeat-containing protein [Gramella sp. AN32]|uniref:VCBS repeat-containing protein n=1 Tax=Christiangramia antarctica TaxID=2058158 RepID=A0ABW5X1N5_9FLAO|nr:VCBS repeat-containing protein [Gramella sp. AN32]MCM4157039.1 RNA-binding protein [Gramella sp. AN32]
MLKISIRNVDIFRQIKQLLHLRFVFGFVSFVFLGCTDDSPKNIEKKLFEILPANYSGISFKNELQESEDFHYYKYIYSYIGGGVAAADFDNDGNIDLLFTSNQGPEKLYRNLGDLKFEDITASSGLKDIEGFDAGISVVDINADGNLDIYICRAGKYKDAHLTNLLYINNGDLTFTEKAEEYGLNDSNRSIQAAFFDFDKDGDLDVYIANSPVITRDYREIKDLKAVQTDPKTIALKGSDKLYRNNGSGKFEDISIQAGIMPDIGFGLNALVGDLNQDGWPDIYVSNDFEIPDFAYINNGDGTFSERVKDIAKHTSYYSMGSDIGDINNDGLNDIIVLDMSPEDYVRSKTTMAMTSIDKFQKMVANEYHYQYMHNVLQLNNGNNTYSEIGLMGNIAHTDWSWSALLADYDLDGYNDIYITNGVFRDVIDQDMTNEILRQIRAKGKRPTDSEFLKYTQMLPQQKLQNYFYRNQGDRTFEDTSDKWADQEVSFSNGAVYADLDNDGDLDLVTNNIQEKASILKNNSREMELGNYLEIQFKGPDKNPFGVGTNARLMSKEGMVQIRQLTNSRGFLSSVSNRLHFGLGQMETIHSLLILWPDGKQQKLVDVSTNQLVEVRYTDAILPPKGSNLVETEEEDAIFTEKKVEMAHVDIPFDDFSKQLLLPHKLSQTGPAVAVSDLDQDGIDDVYVGGGQGMPATLWKGDPSGNFQASSQPDFDLDREYEDVNAAFFDADNDGDQDLYVVSGSYEFNADSPLLQDRLYINNGKGKFKKEPGTLPEIHSSGSIVCPADFDGDGDMDLFVGGRVIPGLYPYAPLSYLLINDQGKFHIGTPPLAPDLEKPGMVTAAQWKDLDKDGDLELIVTGEWIGIKVFENESGRLNQSKAYPTLANTTGWWNAIKVTDVNGDGYEDIIAGNLGLNSKFHASSEKPFHVYTSDFDSNGTTDIMLAKYYKDRQVPVRGKGCSSQQIPGLRNSIPTYKDFASKDLAGILGTTLENALHYEVNEFRSGIFWNKQGKGFQFEPFHISVQQSPINSIIYEDFDGDQIKDLLLAGNNYQAEVETTRSDAGTGTFLKGKGKGEFEYLPNTQTGFYADQDVRALKLLQHQKFQSVLVVNNNSNFKWFTFYADKSTD